MSGISALASFANITITLTTRDFFDVPTGMNPLLLTRSISVEEPFYLVFPFLLMLGMAIGRRRSVRSRGPALVTLFITVLSLSIAVMRDYFPSQFANSGDGAEANSSGGPWSSRPRAH